MFPQNTMKALYKEKVEKVAGLSAPVFYFLSRLPGNNSCQASGTTPTSPAAATPHHVHPFSMRVTVNKDYLLRLPWKYNTHYHYCCSKVNDRLHTLLWLRLSPKYVQDRGYLELQFVLYTCTVLFRLTERKRCTTACLPRV